MSLLDELQKTLEETKVTFDDIKSVTEKAKREFVSEDDIGVWKPTFTNEAELKSTSIIRFLPHITKNADGKLLINSKAPIVRIFHSPFIKTPNGIYFEKCRSTLGEKDPCNQYYFKLHAEGKPEEARRFKRKAFFYSYILVEKDEGCPENEGKVLKFKYGPSIYKMIETVMDKSLVVDEEDLLDPFDLLNGNSLTLVTKRGSTGLLSYENSKFRTKRTIAGGSKKKVEDVIKQLVEKEELHKVADPNTFKSYEELEKLFNKVMGFDTTHQTQDETKKVEETKADATDGAQKSKPQASQSVDNKKLESELDELLDGLDI